MKIILNKILDLIFPEKCSGCGEYGKNLCEICLKNFSERGKKFLNLEKNIFSDKNIFLFEKIYSPFFYNKNNILKKILKEIKYKNKFSKFSGLEEKIFLEFKNFLELEKILDKKIILIPTPLHWIKKLKRGFNQSEIFCDFLEKKGKQEKLNIEKINLIKKIKNTKSQAQSTKIERLENLKNAFEINKKYLKKITKNGDFNSEKNIFIIVDDIISTGETMKNSAIEIKKNLPNGKIFGFTICSDKF